MPIIMFPGQGSQKQGMSPDLVSAYPDLFNQASALLSEDITDIVHSDEYMPHNILSHCCLCTTMQLFLHGRRLMMCRLMQP